MGESRSKAKLSRKKPAAKESSFPIVVIAASSAFALLLILFVAREWRSSSGYNATLTALEQRLTQGKMPRTELDEHLHGFPSRSEITTDGQERQLQLKWSSLFKTYDLRLILDGADSGKGLITRVETPFAAARSSAPGATNPGFAPALAQLRELHAGYENTLALKTSEIGEMKSSLLRELIRQSLLISAEEELHLETVDASLGQIVPDIESPVSYPVELNVELSLDTQLLQDGRGIPANGNYHLAIQLIRRNAQGKRTEWTAPPSVIGYTDRIEPLAEITGNLSLGPFAQGLQAVGYQKNADPAPEPPAEIADHLDLCSQFARVRQLHAQNRV